MTTTAHRSGFQAAFAVAEFRALWAAEALSQVGDQLARVAVAVLVYHRTNSAALAALTLGLSYTPALLGSVLLSGLADRFPRRAVMIVCDVLSAALVLVMAMATLPLWIVCTAMAGVALVGGPFKSARLALLPEMLTGEAYTAALAVRSITIQVAQLIGFAAGGAVVGLINPHLALLIDSGTFLVSAALIWRYVAARPAPGDPATRRPFWSSAVHGARLIAGIPGLGPLFVLGMLAGLYIAPEGLAAAWVAELHAPVEMVGVLMGAPAAGLIIGAWLFTKYLDPDQRVHATGPLAVLAGIALAVCVVEPGLEASVLLLVLSGICTAYQVKVGAAFGTMTPPDGRAQVMGLLNSAVLTAQGLGVLLAGVLADQIGVAHTVAVAGAVGALAAIPAGLAWNRAAG